MKNLFIVSLLFITGIANAQFTNVMISNQSSPNEPSIMIDPNNHNILVGGANLTNFYYSTNSGSNWTRGTLSSTYGVYGDPCIIVDTAGVFYYFHLSFAASWLDRIVCQKSTDGGMTWSNGTYFGLTPPKDQDKQWAVVDRTNNYIYASWTEFDSYGTSNSSDSSRIWFVRSTDGSATWSPQIRLDKLGGDCVDEDNTVEGAVPTVGPNGEVYDAWSGPLVRNSTFGIFFNKSTDHGVTWLSNPVYVGDQPGGWDYMIPGIYRCNGLPIIDCDISGGPHNGNIYINFTDQRNGPTDTDVWIYKSTDGGSTWSSAIRVNDDPAGKQQFLSWMTVDKKTGYVYVLFYDRRNYTNNQTDVYIGKSTDGGATFENIKISATPFLPVSGTFFGDYTNITADDGVVRPIWGRLDGSSSSIWTALIDFTTNVQQTGNNVPEHYSLSQNYPNPFNPSTTIMFTIPENRLVNLSVYDITGKLVRSLVNGEMNAGEYSVTFSGTGLASGAYIYRLNAGGYSFTKKMMLVK